MHTILIAKNYNGGENLKQAFEESNIIIKHIIQHIDGSATFEVEGTSQEIFNAGMKYNKLQTLKAINLMI